VELSDSNRLTKAAVLALTDREARCATPRAKKYELTDEGGLTLVVHPTGSRYWVYHFPWGADRGELSLGKYPLVTLQAARRRASEARELVASGVDPRDRKRAAKTSGGAIRLWT
jgi:hypothetical protein